MFLCVKIVQNLERKFREIAMKKLRYGKGALSKAEEAILKGISTGESETFE